MEPARDLLAAAVDLQPETIALRRMLHRRPEVGLSLPETQAAILTAIDGLPLAVTKGRQVSSVVNPDKLRHLGPVADVFALAAREA